MAAFICKKIDLSLNYYIIKEKGDVYGKKRKYWLIK